MQGLEDLYREVILDHYRDPYGSEPVENPSVQIEGFNPLCGDELVLKLRVEEDRITGLEIAAKGCSISVASASMLAQQVTGLTLREAARLDAAFRGVMRGDSWPEGGDFGDLEALEGVKKFPVRIKCAALAWVTLEQALAECDPEVANRFEVDSDIEVRRANAKH